MDNIKIEYGKFGNYQSLVYMPEMFKIAYDAEGIDVHIAGPASFSIGIDSMTVNRKTYVDVSAHVEGCGSVWQVTYLSVSYSTPFTDSGRTLVITYLNSLGSQLDDFIMSNCEDVYDNVLAYAKKDENERIDGVIAKLEAEIVKAEKSRKRYANGLHLQNVLQGGLDYAFMDCIHKSVSDMVYNTYDNMYTVHSLRIKDTNGKTAYLRLNKFSLDTYKDGASPESWLNQSYERTLAWLAEAGVSENVVVDFRNRVGELKAKIQGRNYE